MQKVLNFINFEGKLVDSMISIKIKQKQKQIEIIDQAGSKLVAVKKFVVMFVLIHL